MDTLRVVREALPHLELLNKNKGIISRKTQAKVASGFVCIYLFAWLWLSLVNNLVPEPYLVSHTIMETEHGD